MGEMRRKNGSRHFIANMEKRDRVKRELECFKKCPWSERFPPTPPGPAESQALTAPRSFLVCTCNHQF